MAKKSTTSARAAAAVTVRHPIKAATLLYSAPKFILRGPIYMMFVSMFAMLIYSTIATTDTLVTAPLTLQRPTVTISAINGGVVERLDVKENDLVRYEPQKRPDERQLLAVIQETIRATSSPEQEALTRQINDLNERLDTLDRDYRYRHGQAETEIRNLATRRDTDLDSLKNRIGQLQNQVESATRSLQNIRSDVGSAQANLARLKPLCDRRDIPATQCDQASQRISDLGRAESNAQSDISNARLSLDSARNDLKKLTDPATEQRMRDDLGKMEKDYAIQRQQVEKQVADLTERGAKAQTLVSGVHYGVDANKGKTYYSVPDTVIEGVGIVTAVHVQRGQLITTGAPLFTIVRNEAPLVARVLAQNKDIGLLKRGQDVKIKYYAYPFQEYGIQLGSIADISIRPSSAPGEANLYVVDVALNSEKVWHLPREQHDENRGKTLETGLTGVAEIKTGDKRFIELLFTPASKFFKAESDSGSAAPAEPAAKTQ